MIEVFRLTESSQRAAEDLSVLAAQLRGELCAMSVNDLSLMLAEQNTILIVARDSEKLVGMATLYVIQKVGRRTAHLEDVVVLESYRGQGIGEKLVRAVISAGRSSGVMHIHLTSHPDRVAAHKLYEKLGFKKRETDVLKLTL